MMSRLTAPLMSRLTDSANVAVARMALRADASVYAAWTGEESDVGALKGPWSAFSAFADNDAGCYVVDSGNNRVVRSGPGGASLGWASAGGPGKGYENLDFPAGGCIDHERYVWIADHDNQRLRRFNEHGQAVEGFGLEPPGPEVLRGPADVASGPDGSVYVADRIRDCVVKFSPQGSVVAEWGRTGRTNGGLSVPCGIAVRHGQFVYVCDSGNDRVHKYTADGALAATWGTRGSSPGLFNAPHGIALDIQENVYVADSENRAGRDVGSSSSRAGASMVSGTYTSPSSGRAACNASERSISTRSRLLPLFRCRCDRLCVTKGPKSHIYGRKGTSETRT